MDNGLIYVIRSAADIARVVTALRELEVGPGRKPVVVQVAQQEEPITDGQRRLLCALCNEIAAALPFPGGGKASGTDWRHFLVGLARGERMAREGEVVVIVGGSISGATKSEASELIPFVESYGAQRGVTFGAR